MAKALLADNLRWKIENISHCWWLKKGESIESPVFVLDTPERMKWSLRMHPINKIDENYVSFFLVRKENSSGPNILEVSFQFAILGKDDSILKKIAAPKFKFMKNCGWGFPLFETRHRVFISEREAFLPEDTLTVQCTIWTTDRKPDDSNDLYATTAIKVKRRSLEWKIDTPGTLKYSIRNQFNNNLIDFDLILDESFDSLTIDMTSIDETIKYISCNASVIDSEGNKENCGGETYFSHDLKKGILSFLLVFPEVLIGDISNFIVSDVLSLYFEFVLAIVEHFDCRLKHPVLQNEVTGEEKSQNATILNADFKSLYKDGILSDMELRTLTKTFPAHKAILSARSPVFRRMFSSDMKEKNNGHVDITDFEDDTIHRMLLYIYTDSIENVQFESACKLYAAADKYQILSLKSRCSSFLKEKLCLTNFSDALILADLHNDGDLKSFIQSYILRQQKEVFCSQEWIDFMNTHLEFAADLMHRTITKNMVYLPKKRKSE